MVCGWRLPSNLHVAIQGSCLSRNSANSEFLSQFHVATFGQFFCTLNCLNSKKACPFDRKSMLYTLLPPGVFFLHTQKTTVWQAGWRKKIKTICDLNYDINCDLKLTSFAMIIWIKPFPFYLLLLYHLMLTICTCFVFKWKTSSKEDLYLLNTS